MHERVGVNRDANVRGPRLRRVEENQIAGPQIVSLYRQAHGELLGDRSRNLNPFPPEHVPDEAAAIEAGLRILTTQPVRRSAESQRLADDPRWDAH